MPLIQCPDCETKVSDKAGSCIKCGYPIQEFVRSNETDAELDQVVADIRDDKSFAVGRQVVNWGGNAILKNIKADIESRDLGPLEPGHFALYLHKSGIRIRNKALRPPNLPQLHHQKI